MNKKKIKVSVIGAGRIGLKLEFDKKRLKPATHFGMWIKNKYTNLSSFCDKNSDSLKFAKKLNNKINYYSNYKKMIVNEKPDIVSISTWKDTHYHISKDCLNLGIKVIVLEKPLANNIKQAKKLLDLVMKKKAKILVNHRRRFDSEIIKLERKIIQGEIGEILQVSSYYVYGILTTGTHLIDTLRMLLNRKIGEINKVIGFKNNLNNFKPRDDVNIDGYLFFEKNVVASIQSLDMKSYDNFDIIIYGTKGKIEITDIGKKILKYKIIKSPEHTGFTELSRQAKILTKSKPRNQFGMLSNNAVSCLMNKKTKSLCDEKDSYKDMLIIDRLLKSSKTNGKKIKI